MQKIGFILYLVVVFSGCSAYHFGKNSNYTESNSLTPVKLSDRLLYNNLSNESFFIEKAEIQFSNSSNKQEFLGSIKFEKPDKYLISLKSKSGIEGVRVYLSSDSLMVNDRLNKVYYYGSPSYIAGKYGISPEFICGLFGDFIPDKKNVINDEDCYNDRAGLSVGVKGLKINYIIDCKANKVISANVGNSLNAEGTSLEYSKMKNISGILVPQSIVLTDSKRNNRILIKILRIQKPWTGTIDFIPGKNYERIKL